MVENLKADIDNESLQKALEMYRLWGGIEVRLRGDDGTDECLTTIPSP